MTAFMALLRWFLAQLRSRWHDLAWIVCLSLVIYGAVQFFGLEAIARQHLNLQNLSLTQTLLIGFIVFLWSCVLFTTFVPLGTVTVFIAGYLLGISAGFIQFGSLCLSSIFLYAVFEPEKHTHEIGHYTRNPWILKLFKTVEHNGVATVCLLRLIPVIPSAACVFISQIMSLSFRDMMKGTLLCGWARPVFFAFIGSQAANLSF